jgi:hypothetical protein
VSARQDQAVWCCSNSTVPAANHSNPGHLLCIINTDLRDRTQLQQLHPTATRQHPPIYPGISTSMSAQSDSGAYHKTMSPLARETPAPQANGQDQINNIDDNTDNSLKQVDNAVSNLVAIYMSNYTSSTSTYHGPAIRSTTAVPSDDNTTMHDLRVPAAESSANHSLQPDTSGPNKGSFDLIFLNATSPSYILLDRTEIGRTGENLIMIWQAPTNESTTPALKEFLTTSEDFYAWVKIWYYWAKIAFFVAGGVYALYRAFTFVNKIRALRRERQADRDTQV